jgi:hypothetical protein
MVTNIKGGRDKMKRPQKISERRGVVWIDFHRSCPKCSSHIPKYRRCCPSCGTFVKNIQGRVFIAE